MNTIRIPRFGEMTEAQAIQFVEQAFSLADSVRRLYSSVQNYSGKDVEEFSTNGEPKTSDSFQYFQKVIQEERKCLSDNILHLCLRTMDVLNEQNRSK